MVTQFTHTSILLLPLYSGRLEGGIWLTEIESEVIEHDAEQT